MFKIYFCDKKIVLLIIPILYIVISKQFQL